MSASIWTGSTTIDSTADADNTFLTQRLAVNTEGQTLFDITNFQYQINTNSLWVFINGVRQALGVDYTETSTTSFTFTSGVKLNDLIDVVGMVGSTGATSAVASATAAAISAAAAQAAYLAILALTPASLPLSIANGGTGQITRQAALDALGGLTTKGDLLVRTAANILRLGIGADGAVLTADSTQASGMAWTQPTPIKTKILANASADTLQLTSARVNYNYNTFNGVCNVTYNATGMAYGTILRIGTPRGSVLATSNNGTIVTFPANIDLALYDSTLSQGLWAGGTVTYGRARTLTGNKYAGSYMLDATTMIVIEVSTAIASTFYIHVINTATGVINTTTYTGGINIFDSGSAGADLIFFNIYPNGANAFILTCSAIASAGTNTCSTGLFTCTVSAGVATVVNATSVGALSGPITATLGFSAVTFQLTATVFVAAYFVASGPSQISFKLFSVAGNVITLGAAATYVGTGGCAIYNILPTNVGGNPGFVALIDDSGLSGKQVVPASYAGTVITLGGVFASASTSGGVLSAWMFAVPATTDHFIVTCRNAANTGTHISGFRTPTLTTGTISAALNINTNNGSDLYGIQGMAAAANLAKYARTDAYKPYVYQGYQNGGDNVLISDFSMVAITSLTSAYGAGAAAITVGNRFNTSSVACKVLQSAITGNKYYTDSNLAITKAFTPAVPTFASGTTLVALDLTAQVWLHENLIAGNVYSYAAGVSTLLGSYNLINTTQPDAVLPTTGKSMVMGTTYCDNLF